MFDSEDASGDRRRNEVAKCPACGCPHHYINLKHPFVNDPGYWEVRCSHCAHTFCIPNLYDVHDSYAAAGVTIERRIEGDADDSKCPLAAEVAVYRLQMNQLTLDYALDSRALYECDCGQALDCAAYAQLDSELPSVQDVYQNCVNAALKGAFKATYVTVIVDIDCLCLRPHQATFYAAFSDDPGRDPPTTRDFVLADVSGVDLTSVLEGVRSKDDAMDLLGKLLMRWNLYADQILIATPFVGHQYMPPDKQLKIWEWLLAKMDPRIAIFLTRATTWSSYRTLLADSGLPLDLLESFGLENKIVASGHTKHDFHAKFYAGIAANWSEVYSGSANLVRGPSMENTSFRRMTREVFEGRYLQPLALKRPLPTPCFVAANRAARIYPAEV